MKTRTQKIVLSAMFASLVCVATMMIKIPSPLSGYINLGDCVVLLSGWCLPPAYAFMAAAGGSALADILSGFSLYAPATFVIKGVMALIAYYGTRNRKESAHLILFGVISEAVMVLCYYLFEGILYGFYESAVNIAANAIQGAVGLVLGIVLFRIFERNGITGK